MKKPKTYFNWSTGKDASLALYHLQNETQYPVDKLITTVNAHHNRVSMHGLRRELLVQQVQAIGLPLTTLELPEQPSMEVYNNKMEGLLADLKREGYTHAGFGDIFLEDLREFREKQLASFNIQCCFPLWKKNTRDLIHEFLDLGFRAIVICIKADLLDSSFVGREIDENFLQDLPGNVDPCGENGEFHTFCFDGPLFNKPINFTVGEKVYREYKSPKDEKDSKTSINMGFWFCDLIPH